MVLGPFKPDINETVANSSDPKEMKQAYHQDLQCMMQKYVKGTK